MEPIGAMARRTRIVATAGAQRTAADEKRTSELGEFEHGLIPHGMLLERFIGAGADVIRLNMAFAPLDEENGIGYAHTQGEYLAWLTANGRGVADRVAVLADLAGPKIRLGDVALGGRKELRRGDPFYLSFGRSPARAPGATVLMNESPFDEVVDGIGESTTFGGHVSAAKEAVAVSVAEGRLELRVERMEGPDVACCRVVSEYVSASDVARRKGLTIKRAAMRVSAFQDADRRALDFLLEHGGEVLAFVAVSFAQTEHDILEVRHYIENHAVTRAYSEGIRATNVRLTARVLSPGVIAKIETLEGWANIDEILDVADGIMVARGDLGEHVPAEEVPEIQKDLIKKCNARGKIVITATQMLDSMERKPSPTRAEAADVFNAILDGTDAVMLSGETSNGCYPITAIRTMRGIAERAERYYFMPGHRRSLEDLVRVSGELAEKTTERLDGKARRAAEVSKHGPGNAREYPLWLKSLYSEKAARSEKQPATDRVCEAACSLSEAPRSPRHATHCPSGARPAGAPKAIVVPTTSGRTALMVSRFRPEGRVIGAAHCERTYRRLLLGFGISPVRIGAAQTRSREAIEDAVRIALDEGLLKPGEGLVATAGTPLFEPGATNLIRLLEAREPAADGDGGDA